MRVFRRGSSLWYSVEYRHPQTGVKVSHQLRPRTSRMDVAQVEAAREYAAAADGARTEPRRVLVSAVLDAYETHVRAKATSTARGNKSRVNWWRTRFGALPASSLTVAMVDRALEELHRDRRLSEASLSNYVIVLRGAFRRALPDHEISRRFRNRYRPAERHVTFTREELEEILGKMEPWARGAMALSLTTGMRVGDVLRAEWAWFTKVPGAVVFPSQKPGVTVTLPLSPGAEVVLQRVPRTHERWLFPALRPRYDTDPHARYQTLYRSWRAVVPARWKTMHDVRRTFATALLNTGSTPRVVAALLGQQSTTMVGRYATTELATLREASARASEFASTLASASASTLDTQTGQNPLKPGQSTKQPRKARRAPPEA